MNNSLQISLPDEWEIKSLNEVLDQMTDYVANGSFKSLRENVTVFEDPNFAYYIRLFDLRLGIGHSKQNYVDEVSYNFLKKSYLKGGEILIANIGANVGEIFMMPSIDRPATIAPNMILCRPNKKMNSKYLFYFLSSSLGKSLISREISGSGQPKLNKTGLKTVPVYTPQLREQQKIASILSSVDETIKKTKGILEQATLVKRGIMHELFSEGIGNTEYKDSEVGRIPKSWKVVDMGTIFDTIDGDRGKNYPNTNDFIDEGYCLFLDTKNVTKSGFMFDTKKFISKEKDKMLRNGKLSRNDFVMTSRGSIGNIAFYSENVPYENIRINSAMLILRPYDKDLNFDFWMHLLRGRVIEKYIRKFKVGSAQPHITKKSFQQLKVSIPSSSKEQQKISNILNEFDNKIRNEEENLLYLDSLKRGLMQQLLTGKVRVPTTESEEVPQ